ncbi:MAG: NAD-dependent succinate-semialdehyde dehydrogenase [Candidatus Krumholzibacteriia bacterium]
MAITTINPATGETLATYEHMPRTQVLAILGAVAEAQRAWAESPVRDRAGLFHELAAVLRRQQQDHAELMSREMGKPITEARGEVEKCAWLCEVYADHAERWLAEEAVEADGLKHRVIYEPLGVVLSIMPWNYPYWQALRFAVPTLCAGNAGILKHASNVTGCSLAIEQLFRDAGFPDDLFRSVLADHATVGELIADSRVRGVSLTGSTEAGERIAEAAGRHLKKVVLELGGSDPFIVLEDADIEVAARNAVKGRMLCTGQSCIAAKRFIVVRRQADVFVARFAALMAGLKLGDPLDEATEVGAIVNEGALDELIEQIDDAVHRGAHVLAGGQRADRAGIFLEPTVLSGVAQDMRVIREEVFGPVAPVIVVEDEDEAVRVANDSPFGLGGSVWTRDLERGERVARRLASGTVFVNSITKSDPRMPFGGIKQSGIGRELSWFGLREFCNIKGLNIYEHG